jgi:hypothetical protein
VTTTAELPVSLDAFVPCAMGGTGETVHLSGTLNAVVQTTLTENGWAVTRASFNPKGVVGTGSISGDSYRGTGATILGSSTQPNGTTTTIFVSNFRVLGPGTGNDLVFRATIHVTTLADGTITALVSELAASCG